MTKRTRLTIGLIAAIFLLACACPASSLPTLNQNPTAIPTNIIPVVPTIPAIATATDVAVAPSTGNVLLTDDFNVQSTEFETYSDENGVVETRDGVYLVRAISDLWHWGRSSSEFTNTVAEFDVTLISGPSNNNAGFGIVCRLTERDDTSVDGYMLAISGDGYYTIRSVTASNMSPLVDWTYTDVINQGTELNHVRATCSDTELKLEVNSQLVAQASPIAGGSTSGALAFSAISFEDAEKIAEIHFDNLIVREP
ncbi:MAG: hypothetical protein IPO22_21605 [Anaerolineales bacterium]|nr:hypothetical protein [Anaerolineales bacterium]